MLVAFWRAMADMGTTNVRAFSDPFARDMLRGRAWQLSLDRIVKLANKPEARRNMSPYLDMIALRVASIDALLGALQPAQVVCLGAGLDTRAWRLPVLRDVPLFEVDHPDTQRYKRERSAHLPAPLARLSFVAADFQRDDLSQRLTAHGFDSHLPTVWLWEGVIMYLDDAALRGTLRAIRRASAPGSALIAHYHEPSQGGAVVVSLIRRLMLSYLREPQIGLRTRETMHAELERAGFLVAEDAGVAEQAARVDSAAPKLAAVQASRVVLANLVADA